MADPTDSRQLAAKVLAVAESQPFFVASRLAMYASSHGINEAELADLLRCEIGQLSRLAFCRVPTGDAFVAEVRRIAEFVPCEPDALAQLLRMVALITEQVSRVRVGEDK